MSSSVHLLLLTATFILLISHARAIVGTRLMEGLKINCCVMPQYPAVYTDKERQPFGLNGIAVDYLERLQDRLGFECRDLPQLVSTEASFNGMVDAMERCTNGTADSRSAICQCQLGVGSWIKTAERVKRVDFLTHFMRDELEMIVHVENTDSTIRGAYFLTTFTPTVWVLIVGLFVLFTFLKILDRRFAPPGPSYVPLDRSEPRYLRFKHYILKSRIPFRVRKAVQSTLGRLVSGTGDGSDETEGSSRQWLLNFAILLCSVFVLLTYGATMTASLVQESIRSDYRTIEDLRNCHVPPTDVCIPKGGIAEGFWRLAVQGRRSCHEGKFPRLIDTFDETVQAVVDKKCKFAILDAPAARDVVTGRYCRRIMQTGKSMYWGGDSFILPRGSNLTEAMGTATLELREAGRLQTLDEFFSRRGGCEKATFTKLTFTKLKFFFALSYISCLVLFVFMLFDPQTPPGLHITDRHNGANPCSSTDEKAEDTSEAT